MKERVSEIINEVSAISIIDVIGMYVETTLRCGRLRILCPFHDDHNVGSFSVDRSRNVFKCFSCGAKGNGIKFAQMYEAEHNNRQLTYVQAALLIAVTFGLITEKEYSELSSKKYKGKTLETRFKASEQNNLEIAERRDVEERNFVYRVLMRGAALENKESDERLTKEHKDYLLSRGLSEEDVLQGEYFSMPSKKCIKKIVDELYRRDKKQDFLLGVPGFYLDKKSNKVLFKEVEGIGIPIKDANNQVQAIQVRRDKVQEGGIRYVWLSSLFADGSENAKDKSMGCSPGTPISVVYPQRIKCPFVFITEGQFKAVAIAKEFGAIVCTVQGVCSWREINEVIDEIRSENDVRGVYIAFDADMAYNLSVFKQAIEMAKSISVGQTDLSIRFALWNVKFGKGIDDMIAAGNAKEILGMDRTEFEVWFNKLCDVLMYTHNLESLTELKNLDKEVIRSEFERIVLSKAKRKN